ncbi:MAG: hypothetical protein RR672_10485, partial [Raoultibacter sp.]
MMSLEQAYNVTEVLGCTLDELCGRKVIRTFPDPSQAAINASYENMNDEGRKALLKVARGMEKDTDNRIFKDSPEYTDGSAAMGA